MLQASTFFENMAAEQPGTNQLTITELWIREKLRLQNNCLADVRSVCLPGSYEGKIRHLGNSLKNFVRLKVLDLSHNVLTSVEGLQHLKMLEHLNLYFNRISSLKEVLVLRKLKALRELDLRLNPVVKNCVDYRLQLVYTLSNLRMLDDCPIRDGERKACLQHFSCQSVVEPEQMPGSLSDTADQSSSQPRMTSVNRLTRSLSLLDQSDDQVLNLVARSNWDLSKPPGLTGSVHKEPDSKLYPLSQDNLGSGDQTAEMALVPKQDSFKSILRHPQDSRETGPQPQSSLQPQKGVALAKSDGLVRASEGLRVTFIDAKQMRRHTGPEKDRSQGPSRFPAKGNFTPNPGGSLSPPPPAHVSMLTSQSASPGTSGRSTKDAPAPSPKSPQVSVPKEKYRRPLELLLGLVDRHWEGKRSLQHNSKFLTQAIQILSTMERDVLNEDVDVRSLRVKVEALYSERLKLQRDHESQMDSLSAQLKHAERSIEDLDQQLRGTLEENVTLQKQLIRVEQKLLDCGRSGPADSEPAVKQGSGEELRRQLEEMRVEVEQLRKRLRQSEKVQELADMLQGSHRSLVSTNERLLLELEESRARHRQELEESRARHRAEVEQLHFSFSELSKTFSLMTDVHRNGPQDI
ncbi:hypothetical protein AGOR_G00211670 [Albula goreensis]|uniref:Centrosomal protein of 72 kDa n=1 Tax=Albula goreensis TaxID=1534307 RepID=A0A8T3CRM3_9TELE|nr:hypothetical protein AGOR_G00211670 [Albula goreensis]